MTTPEQQAETAVRLRKLKGKASRLKLDLHDLAEDLPSGWEQIPELATRTHQAYAEIAQLEAELAGKGMP